MLCQSLGVVLLLAILPTTAAYGDAASVLLLRRGHFAEITDAESSGYVIESFRMASNGSRVAFYVRQTTQDARGCFAYQLRLIDADGLNETVVEQGFTYDTGVGNFCANGLFDCYDISATGGEIAFLRLRNPGNLRPELVLHDVDTGVQSVVLQTLPHRSYGETHTIDIDPMAGRQHFAMSGDGTQIFFVNRFGPYGSPGSTGEPEASGLTVYRVFADMSGVEAVYSSADLASTPGVVASAVHVVASGGWLAVDGSGTLLLLPVGGSFPSANPPRHVLRIDPDLGSASAEVYLDFVGLGLSGPSLSSDGGLAVFARGGSADPSQNGLFAKGSSPEDPEVLLDANLRWAANPSLSGDGAVVVHNVDLGGGSSPALRYATTDGGLLLPLNEPIVRTRFDYGAVSDDGSRVVLCGAVKGTNAFAPISQFNLVRMDWGSEAAPAVTQIWAEPELTLLRTTIFDYAPPLNTHFYTVMGGDAAAVYTYPFNRDASVPGGTSRFHIHGGILDDGAYRGDAVAGDGIFTENALYVTSVDVEAPMQLRVGVTGAGGVAGFVDAEVPLRDKEVAVAAFDAYPVIGAAPLPVTFADRSTGDYLETRWDFQGNYQIDQFGARGETALFSYGAAGLYRPALTVTGRGSTHELRNSRVIRVFASLAVLAETLVAEFDTADADASGALTLAEVEALVPGMDSYLFAAWDGDADGAISRRELLLGAGGAGTVHSGDQDANLRIQLSELLRVIQFYNSGGYHCAETPLASEDGYAPGPGDQGCSPHRSDYQPQDWAIQLSELLRLIQFYNSGGYLACPGTEDDFCPR